MKVYCISDLHLSLTCDKPMDIFGPVWEGYWDKIVLDWKSKVSEDDIVLISGDISWAMKLEDAICDILEINKLPGKKVFIRGNHDYWWKSLSAIRSLLPENCYVIQNDSLKIGNYVFCGTRGWNIPENEIVNDEDKKMLNREMQRLELSLKSASTKLLEGDNLVCLIHYPPFNSRLENSIFTDLLEKYKVKKCVYGHLHGTSSRSVLYFVKNDVEYYLTSCDKTNNQLILISEEKR
ncbi:MAG TPA: hypothetical protein DCO89_03440 [Clostridiales bacterium]|nr:hypothetical protein [Clostridiales bacterium]